MAMVTVNFRMDEELKKAMEKVCEELGMNMTTAFMIYAKKMTREHRIPFEVSSDPFYSEMNMRYLDKVISEYETGKSKMIAKTMEELEAMENE
ncbi:MAG: type II toxin-antitoxin system RelB/DinJ family antitoxin [Ruminococcus sp.]|nr:type II toxin-antitoxin system RelB/DinJ family antitoxin [Ruminococcus sp.]